MPRRPLGPPPSRRLFPCPSTRGQPREIERQSRTQAPRSLLPAPSYFLSPDTCPPPPPIHPSSLIPHPFFLPAPRSPGQVLKISCHIFGLSSSEPEVGRSEEDRQGGGPLGRPRCPGQDTALLESNRSGLGRQWAKARAASKRKLRRGLFVSRAFALGSEAINSGGLGAEPPRRAGRKRLFQAAHFAA